LYKDGKLIEQMMGAVPKGQLKSAVLARLREN
jgi:hypothetical protein